MPLRVRRRLLAAEPRCTDVALSCTAGKVAARALYASLGFGGTGETEDDGTEVVARWIPGPG